MLSTSLPWELARTKWASDINPIIILPMLNGVLIKNVTLVASTPLVINTLLSRQMQGWFLADNSANAVVWRTQPFNTKTITLEASADTTINLWVF